MGGLAGGVYGFFSGAFNYAARVEQECERLRKVHKHLNANLQAAKDKQQTLKQMLEY